MVGKDDLGEQGERDGLERFHAATVSWNGEERSCRSAAASLPSDTDGQISETATEYSFLRQVHDAQNSDSDGVLLSNLY